MPDLDFQKHCQLRINVLLVIKYSDPDENKHLRFYTKSKLFLTYNVFSIKQTIELKNICFQGCKLDYFHTNSSQSLQIWSNSRKKRKKKIHSPLLPWAKHISLRNKSEKTISSINFTECRWTKSYTLTSCSSPPSFSQSRSSRFHFLIPSLNLRRNTFTTCWV